MSSPADPDPRPHSLAALALIRREERGRTLFLAQWNLQWRALQFVGGHKEPGESFRDCLVREIDEELGLALGADYRILDQSPLRLAFEAFSDSAWMMNSYVFELFPVELTGESAWAKVAANPDNRWVSKVEVLSGRCADSTRISPTMARIVMSLSLPTI